MASSESEKTVAPQHKSAFFSFIKSLATSTSDLSTLSAPPFLLSPQSIVEFSAYWAEHPQLFIAPALEKDPAKRALSVLQWFISTLGAQHGGEGLAFSEDEGKGRRKGKGMKKPLNPVLGEVFKGSWEPAGDSLALGTTRLVAEQVSHHPPATACCVWNERHGVRLQSHIAPSASFSSTIHIHRRGHTVLTLSKHNNETYLITMPKIHLEGLLSGSLAPELSGSSYIRSSTGYTAKIDYTGKGWISGKRNGFFASLVHDSAPGQPIYQLEGCWSGEYTIREENTGNVKDVDTRCVERMVLTVAPIESQHYMESRRLWQPVADAIRKGDILAVGKEKHRIEQAQREVRKQEKEEGREWKARYFRRVEGDWVTEKLLEGMSGEGRKVVRECMAGRGTWVWDVEGEVERRGRRGMGRVRFDSGVGGMGMSSEGKQMCEVEA